MPGTQPSCLFDTYVVAFDLLSKILNAKSGNEEGRKSVSA